ncbi:MAG: hypothetical protein PVI57_01620 [Gemmatimonadota bacterium]|jgi:hypothetical protein
MNAPRPRTVAPDDAPCWERGLGVLCPEGQADGVPCLEGGADCECCDRAIRPPVRARTSRPGVMASLAPVLR